MIIFVKEHFYRKGCGKKKAMRLCGEKGGHGRWVWVLTAGADVALVAVEKAVSNPDVCPCGRVS